MPGAHASATRGGSGPATVTQYVLKVHSRCDLACDHCYVYEHADQSWRVKPRAMAEATAVQAARRIAEHARQHALPVVHVIVHGGEPLLLGPQALDRLLAALRAGIAPATKLDLRMHTNAVRLNEEYCDILRRHDVRVGVSLDGGQTANDLHRRFADGRSSHRQVLDGISLLRRPEFRELYAGILCTIDVRNDPIAVYEALMRQAPPRVDFLLPHATWEQPPLRLTAAATEYADWLAAVYERWQADGQPVPIRTFEALEATAAGLPSGSESLGTDPVDLVVIETDGSFEQADSLKVAYADAPATGFNVFDHAVDEAAAHPALAARRTGISGLSMTCRACPVVRRCGGGLYAHRYRADNGFDNPSVYCADLKALTQRIPHGDVPPLVADIARVPAPAAAVHELAEAWAIDNRALVAAAAQRLGLTEPPVPAWELLVRLDRTAPDSVTRMLARPYVRTWAVRVLEQGGDAVDADYLQGLTFGAQPPSHPSRHLRAHGVEVVLEDSDPAADVYPYPVAYRLSDAEVDAWQQRFTDAMAFLNDHLPHYVPPLRAGLRSITPLQTDSADDYASGTARHAPGAIGVALPDDPEVLALLIIHEFQHVILWAAMSRHDLIDEDSPGLLHVAWRPDPRPPLAVLHGIYAHIAVADYWRAQRNRSDRAPDPAAEARYAYWSAAVHEACDALRGTAALTPLGATFLSHLARQWRGRAASSAG
jgi:uncharacterized protein